MSTALERTPRDATTSWRNGRADRGMATPGPLHEHRRPDVARPGGRPRAAVPGAAAYGCLLCLKPLSSATTIDAGGQLIIGASDFVSKMDVNKSRKKVFTGLTAGVIYYLYFYALNSAGVSTLSKVESIMFA